MLNLIKTKWLNLKTIQFLQKNCSDVVVDIYRSWPVFSAQSLELNNVKNIICYNFLTEKTDFTLINICGYNDFAESREHFYDKLF